jgi:uncharacterized damage-inducible protein DinB
MWSHEAAQTARVVAELTDDTLDWRIVAGQRTLGEVAWHIVVSQHEIVGKTGLAFEAPGKFVQCPLRASEILSTYRGAATALAEAVKRSWTDASLAAEDEIYGMRWTRGYTLSVMVLHEVHHRGQLTALMRAAGLKVPGMYGPSGDERQT